MCGHPTQGFLLAEKTGSLLGIGGGHTKTPRRSGKLSALLNIAIRMTMTVQS